MAEIWAFIAADSLENATRFIHKLNKSFTPLLDQPLIGPARDDLSPGLRVHFYREYAIYYVPTKHEIIIVRVVHSRRDQATLFKEK